MSKDVKNKTSTILLDYYKKNRNLRNFIEVSRQMLIQKGTSPLIRGEICEVVLSVILTEFILKNKLNSKGWFISKGLIVNDKYNSCSDYLTEIDLTLFTPKMVYIFECKSYKGSKVLRDKGSLYVKNGTRELFKLDVFEQNRKHSLALLKYLIPYLTNKSSSNKLVKMIMFDFSIGEYEDLRDDKYKKIFPLLNDRTVLRLFDTYSSKDDVWNMRGISSVVDELNSSLSLKTEDHLNYVKSLRRGSK